MDVFASLTDDFVLRLMHAIGMEPTHHDFNHRKKMLFISRLIPMVERNFNFVELGPRNTGKSFVFRKIAPNAILISGGRTTVANLLSVHASRHREDWPGGFMGCRRL